MLKERPLTAVEYQDYYDKQGYNPNVVKKRVTIGEDEYIFYEGTPDDAIENTIKELKKISGIIMLVLGITGFSLPLLNCQGYKIGEKVKCESDFSDKEIGCDEQSLRQVALELVKQNEYEIKRKAKEKIDDCINYKGKTKEECIKIIQEESKPKAPAKAPAGKND